MMTPSQQSSEEVKRDIQATLAARRELGPAYDDHFIDALAEKIAAQARRDVANAQETKQKSNALSREQRTSIATTGGITFVLAAIAMIVLVNAFASR